MNSWKVENTGRLLTEVKNKFLGAYSLKEIRWSIEHNHCFVNKKVERFGSLQVKKGDTISITIEKNISCVQNPKRIIFEDRDLLIYDKPPFLSSENLSQITQTLLVHRLDRDTSGLIILAKHTDVATHLEKQFLKRTLLKDYLALVEGHTQDEGTISGNMAIVHKREGAVIWGMKKEGVWSETHWRCLLRLAKHTLVQCKPTTGRTHQIRLHLKHIGHPIVGDYTYGSQLQQHGVFRPLLHAARLKFLHPTSQKVLTFSAPLPQDFLTLLPEKVPIPLIFNKQ